MSAERWAEPLGRVARCLVAIHGDRLDPPEALAAMRGAAASPAAIDVDLVWQREPYDGRYHYDALVRDGSRGTFALSFCPHQEIPFQLRGVQRFAESDVLRVDDTTLKVGEAMEALEFLWKEVRLIDRIVDTCIIKGMLDRAEAGVDDEALVRGVDAFRAARGLRTVAETEGWLRERGLTQLWLEATVGDELRLARLRREIVGAQVDRRLEQNPRAFDEVQLTYFEVGDAAAAGRLTKEIAAAGGGAAELAAAAEASLAEGAGGAIRVVRLRRHHIEGAPPDLHVGAVIACRIGRARACVARVRAIAPATPDPATMREIEGALFDEWLAARRREARIEWNWGTDPDPDEASKAPEWIGGASVR